MVISSFSFLLGKYIIQITILLHEERNLKIKPTRKPSYPRTPCDSRLFKLSTQLLSMSLNLFIISWKNKPTDMYQMLHHWLLSSTTQKSEPQATDSFSSSNVESSHIPGLSKPRRSHLQFPLHHPTQTKLPLWITNTQVELKLYLVMWSFVFLVPKLGTLNYQIQGPKTNKKNKTNQTNQPQGNK